MSARAPHYLDTAESVDGFLAGLTDVRALALDTEGASFHRFVDRIYLLQLSTAEREAVIDPLPIGTPARLGGLLEDPQVEVVLHDADYDLRLLHQDYGWRVTHLFDTRVAAQLLGIRAFGLAALLEQFFGIKLDKKHQRADWSMRPLTADMLDYAAQDTRFLLSLRDRLHEELVRKGRWHWAQEEFTRAEGTRWEPEVPDTSFLRLKGARDLTRRELARLRELVRWRDTIAAELDRATFRVAGNEVLLDLARTAPSSRDSLFSVKGFPRGMSEARAQEALQAIVRGNKVPDADLPRFPKAARWDREPDFDERVARLKAIRDAAAADLDLDPGVLCSRDRMEAVARRRPRHVDDLAELPELRRWQVEVLGPAFVKELAGSAADDSPYKPG
ncbi:HRDC domain-containing protein [Gemmatimonas aurantiaca]|uniref:ribonuclease D n=1 Tax=Gemmatimonas aurantiaca TaxID=173480 RepID=UPI00301DF55D